jgi:hypothetical protein
VTWYEHACAFADARWPKVAAKGRISLVEGLMAVTPVLVTSQRGAPDPEILRQAMRRWAFNPPCRSSPMPAEIDAALRWLARVSLPVSALQEAGTVSRAMDACGRKLDGSAAAPEYYRRRRRIFYAALKYADAFDCQSSPFMTVMMSCPVAPGGVRLRGGASPADRRRR